MKSNDVMFAKRSHHILLFYFADTIMQLVVYLNVLHLVSVVSTLQCINSFFVNPAWMVPFSTQPCEPCLDGAVLHSTVWTLPGWCRSPLNRILSLDCIFFYLIWLLELENL